MHKHPFTLDASSRIANHKYLPELTRRTSSRRPAQPIPYHPRTASVATEHTLRPTMTSPLRLVEPVAPTSVAQAASHRPRRRNKQPYELHGEGKRKAACAARPDPFERSAPPPQASQPSEQEPYFRSKSRTGRIPDTALWRGQSLLFERKNADRSSSSWAFSQHRSMPPAEQSADKLTLL